MSLRDIFEIQEQRKEREKKVFRNVYERVKAKINLYASKGSLACVYKIPNFIVGFPLIDVPKTTEYIIKKLKKEGFICFQVQAVNQTDTNIYISWELNEIQRRKYLAERKEEIKNSRVSLEDYQSKRDDQLIESLVAAKFKNK